MIEIRVCKGKHTAVVVGDSGVATHPELAGCGDIDAKVFRVGHQAAPRRFACADVEHAALPRADGRAQKPENGKQLQIERAAQREQQSILGWRSYRNWLKRFGQDDSSSVMFAFSLPSFPRKRVQGDVRAYFAVIP